MSRLARNPLLLHLGWLVFAVVFLLRIYVLARLTTSPFLLPTRGDMHFYNEWALRILHGEMTQPHAFYGLPLYPYLLATLYRLFGYNAFVPGILQAAADAGTAALIYAITARLLSSGRGNNPTDWAGSVPARVFALLAALGWALFVPAQTYTAILMPTSLCVFAFWFVVWMVIRTNTGPTTLQCLALGLIIGVTAMGNATIAVVIPLVLLAAAVRPRSNSNGPGRNLFFGAALLLLGFGLGTSPCWLHNYLVARDPVFLSAHSGINFWIGNNPDANGYPRFPPGLRAGQAAMLEDSIVQAEVAAGRSLKRSEVSAYWSGKAKDYIKSHFTDWLKLLAVKLKNFWSAFQYDDLSVITSLREEGVTLPGLYFGWVAALALPGLLLAWKIPGSHWLLLAIVLAMAGLLPVFVTERYRLVVVPGLLVFAAAGLSILWRSVVANDSVSMAAYLGLVSGAVLFVSWPQRNPSLWALDAYNSGWQALESGNLTLAERKLAVACAYVPQNSETMFALGNLRFAQEEVDAAKSFYQATLTLDHQHKGALNNLGVLALQKAQYPEAESWFHRAEEIDPRNAKTHFLLAQALLSQGDRAGAAAEIKQAISLNPDQPEFKTLSQQIEAPSP